MRMEMKSISPAVAKGMLKRNINNRPLKESHVKWLAEQMTNGLWQFDGMPIRLTEAGGLIDGQHRLSAIVMSGKTFDFYVASGIPETAFKVMDTGRNRQATDVLSVAGYNANNALPTMPCQQLSVT